MPPLRLARQRRLRSQRQTMRNLQLLSNIPPTRAHSPNKMRICNNAHNSPADTPATNRATSDRATMFITA